MVKDAAGWGLVAHFTTLAKL